MQSLVHSGGPIGLTSRITVRRRRSSSAEKVVTVAADLPAPTYGIDDDTAIQVVDSAIEIISEGHGKLFTR